MNNYGNESNWTTQAPPPPYERYEQPVSKEAQLTQIVNKYEISNFFSTKLQVLNSFKIVYIFDDSGSMNTTLSESPLNTGLLRATRWDELKYFAKISIEIANIFNSEGTDVYFLNRPMVRGVRHMNELLPHFDQPPNGYTPLVRTLGTVLNNNSSYFLKEKQLLVIIVTDGEPTDDQGRNDVKNFKQLLSSRSAYVYTTIVACTDQDYTMDYLNHWDKIIPRLDVVDDFRSERKEIIRAQGQHFSFTFGDYVVKSLIGSVDPSIDNLDEPPHSSCAIL